MSLFFLTFAPEYVRLHGNSMPMEHKKVIATMIICKTEENGSLVYECKECGEKHLLFRSCGNRQLIKNVRMEPYERILPAAHIASFSRKILALWRISTGKAG